MSTRGKAGRYAPGVASDRHGGGPLPSITRGSAAGGWYSRSVHDAVSPRAARDTRVLLASGAIGPAAFWVLGGVVAATWPGYDPIADSISSMVHAPLGGLQILAFAIGGPLTLAWAIGAGRVLGATPRDRTIVRAVFAVQAAIALAFALLPTDASGAPATLVGSLHLATFYAYAIVMPASLLLVGRVFAGDPAWRPASRPTVVAAMLLVVATLLVPLTIAGPLEPWLGLLERIYVGIPGAWQVVVALRALRLDTRTHATEASAA
jgi:hypothetical protein